MKVAILCFEKDKEALEVVANHLKKKYSVEFIFYSKAVWEDLISYDCIVSYLAAGIVIRGLCKHLKNKREDPAIVVLDKPLKHAVPILGAHKAGNEVAMFLSEIGIKPVILTALEFSDGFVVGVGFRKNVGSEEIIEAIMKVLSEAKIDFKEVKAIATIASKKNSQIVEVADKLKRPIIFIEKDGINELEIRETKAKIIGVKNVCEACAILSSRFGELVVPKKVYGGVTVAIAR